MQQGLDPKVAYVRSIAYKSRTEEFEAFKDFFYAVFKVNPDANELLDMPMLTTKRTIDNYEVSLTTFKKNVEDMQYKLSLAQKKADESKKYQELIQHLEEKNDATQKELETATKKLTKAEKLLLGFGEAMELVVEKQKTSTETSTKEEKVVETATVTTDATADTSVHVEDIDKKNIPF
jgi:hypothetical protein